MNEAEYISFLKSYTLGNESVKLIKNIEDINKATIPLYWKNALMSSDEELTKKIILDEWKKYSDKELSNTIAYLEEYLKKVDLICVDGEFSLIYNISSYQSGEDLIYEGKNPIQSEEFMCMELKVNWSDIEQSLKSFYTCVHNGFYDYTSKSMGLDSTENIESILEYDWEYIDQIDIDMSNLFSFFSNGMGQYVVLDTKKSISKGAYLWSNKNLPKGNLNFWDIIDEWTVIGFDN